MPFIHECTMRSCVYILDLDSSSRTVWFDWQHIDELVCFINYYVLFIRDTDYMCIIIGRICSIWTGRVYRVIGQTIYRWTLYVFLYAFRCFIYTWHILHEYYTRVNSFWTVGIYQYDTFMIRSGYCISIWAWYSQSSSHTLWYKTQHIDELMYIFRFLY